MTANPRIAEAQRLALEAISAGGFVSANETQLPQIGELLAEQLKERDAAALALGMAVEQKQGDTTIERAALTLAQAELQKLRTIYNRAFMACQGITVPDIISEVGNEPEPRTEKELVTLGLEALSIYE